MEDLLKQLNESQRAAVEFNEGPSLIIAGAGSGKTRVLTYKIAYLLKQGCLPQHILALTFTNKAAREMKERIASLVGEKDARRLWMGTFHSIFSRILRVEAEKLGFQSNFTIADGSDSKNLIKAIIKEMQLDDKIYKPGKIQNIISNAKNALISASAYAQNKAAIEADQMARIPQVKDIYRAYSIRLKTANTMDFDDLLYYTNILFRDHPETLAQYQARFQYVLVDEYQDTNVSQYRIVKELAQAHHRVCVVGDDAQSIYSFRGANIDNILNFQDNYPEARIFKLEQNYRSTQNIVNAANSLIKQNADQIKKNIYSKNEEGEKIEVSSAFSDFEEGVIVTNRLMELRRDKNNKYSDFVILYRTNAQSRIFEESLRKRNIPYRIYGGLSFYQRKEIKDVIAYFRLVVNPYDEEAFKRIINFPTRGIGQTTLNKIIASARLHNVSLWQVIGESLEYNLEINAGTAKKLKDFRDLIDSFIADLTTLSAYELANRIVRESGIAKDAYQDQTPEGTSRQENLQELLGGIHEFCETRQEEGVEEIGLMNFLAEVSLLSDQDTDKEHADEKVTMMTIHASKGLEFKNVFVVGLEEDLFPSSMAKSEPRGLEEERRLFYVAITRSEEFCMLSFARSRFRNGQTNPCNPSRFLRDIDSTYLKVNQGVFNEIKINSYKSDDTPRIWDNNKPNRETSEKGYNNTPSYKHAEQRPINNIQPSPISRKMVSVDKASPKIGAGTEINNSEIKVGAKIEHERFGFGIITELTGDSNSRKASVEFENAGTKQLLLKFARFKIIS